MSGNPIPKNPPTNNGNTDSNNEWVRITSPDGFSYLVKRKVANASGTFKNTLDAEMMEAKTLTCSCNERATIVEKLCEYMSFKTYYETIGPKEEVPIHELIERLHPEITLELMLAADYHEFSFKYKRVKESFGGTYYGAPHK